MKKIGKYKYYILSFLIPMSLLLIYFFINNIRPDNLLISDMRNQYIALFNYERDVLLGNESILYSFNNGLGGSMIATISYYLSSPLNILVVLFKKENLALFVLVILLLKVGLCGLNMNIFLKYKFKISNCMILIFSICYALMNYIINYYFNIMWLDSIYLLPLVIMGIDKLMKENKKGLYCISLFMTIISNFYTGYMVCIFSTLYFFYNMFINFQKKEYCNKIINFFICSLLVGFCTSFLLLPTVSEILNLGRKSNIIFTTPLLLKRISYFFIEFFIGSHINPDILDGSGLNLYCGLLSFVGVVFFFLNSKISNKEKIITGLFLLILFMSCIFLPLQNVWHGFSLPNFWNNRMSFIFSFFIIFISARFYENFEINYKNCLILIIFYLILGIILLCYIPECFKWNHLLITLLFLIGYLFLINQSDNKNFKFILLIFVLLEMFINISLQFLNFNQGVFSEFSKNMCGNINNLDTNYRISEDNRYSYIDSFICNYSTVTSFLSTNNLSKYEWFTKVGYVTEELKIKYLDNLSNTPLIDSLIGVKYVYSSSNDSRYKKLDNSFNLFYYDVKNKNLINKKYSLFENSKALSIGYMIKSKNVSSSKNVFEYQNELIKNFSGIDKNPLIPIKVKNFSNNKYEIVTDNINRLYIKINYESKNPIYTIDQYDVYINDEKIKNYSSVFYYDNINNESTSTLFIDLKDNNIYNINADFYTLDDNILNEQLQELSKNQATNVIKNKNQISFNIDSNQNGTLLVTIPYDKNFKIYVDNNKTKFKKIDNMFIGIDLDKGNHSIKIIYSPNCLILGIFISIFSFGLLLVFCKKMSIKNNNI